MHSAHTAASSSSPRPGASSPSRAAAPPRQIIGRLFVIVLVLAVSQLGCASVVFISKVRRANEHFEKAKAVGAERYSPYEYFGAEARLQQAKHLAAEAEYGSANRLADESRELSEVAIKNTNQALSASGSKPNRDESPSAASKAPVTKSGGPTK